MLQIYHKNTRIIHAWLTKQNQKIKIKKERFWQKEKGKKEKISNIFMMNKNILMMINAKQRNKKENERLISKF